MLKLWAGLSTLVAIVATLVAAWAWQRTPRLVAQALAEREQARIEAEDASLRAEPEPVVVTAPTTVVEPDAGDRDSETIPRVGQAGVAPPNVTSRVEPRYPGKATKIRLQGYVILEAIFRADGRIDDVKVLRGLGKGKFGFEEEAVSALKRWRFEPGRYQGQVSDVRMTSKIDFVLQ